MIQNNNYSFAERMNFIPESFIREILKVASNPKIISFAGGLPNPQLFPSEKLAIAAEKVFTKYGKEALQYTITEGYLPLRAYIAERQSAIGGNKIIAENVLILNGSQQGLDILGKIFIDPGKPILMEAPTYLGAIQSFSAYQPEFHDIKIHEGGFEIDFFKKIITQINPKLFYCIPNFQNPTGYSYTLSLKEQIAEIIRATELILIEDNPYGELYFSQNRIIDLVDLIPEQTINLGSFSKILSPGMRTGWAIGPSAIIKKMTIAKQASDLHTNLLSQRIIYEFLLSNSLDEHLYTIKKFYKRQSEIMIILIKKYFPEEIKVEIPKGGMFIWAILPDYIDATLLLNKSMEQNVLFVPGENFYANQNPPKNSMRINFSNPSIEAMEVGIKILGKLISDLIKI